MTPAFQAIQPGEVASYTINVHDAGVFSSTVNLLTASPSASLTLDILPNNVTPPGQATLWVTDTHAPGDVAGGVQFTLPVTGTAGGQTRSAGVELLVGGQQVYLPSLLK